MHNEAYHLNRIILSPFVKPASSQQMQKLKNLFSENMRDYERMDLQCIKIGFHTGIRLNF